MIKAAFGLAMVLVLPWSALAQRPASTSVTIESNNGVDIGDVDVTSMPGDATELGAAQSLDDNLTPPSSPFVFALLYCWDTTGGNADRCDSGPATPLSYISDGATEDEHPVCTGACTLWSVAATNINASAAFLKCENDTEAGTVPGTDTPELRLAIPGNTSGAGFTHTFPVGARFSTALTCWIVTGAADSDVTEVTANEVMVFYTYK